MMFIVWLPILIALGFAIAWMARPGVAGGCCGGHSVLSQPQTPAVSTKTTEDAVEIARQRLARGEITTAEYEEIRRVLLG